MAEDKVGTNRIQKAEMLRDDMRRLDTPENIIRKAVERKYPKINAEESRKIITELVTKPGDTRIRIGDEDVRIDSLNEYVADTIELINAGSSDYGSSSESEYFGWIQEGQDVIQNMNDGDITVQDLDDKHKLLHDFEQREVDLMTCISLYKRCDLENPKIRQKYEELSKKLLRLREIRSAVENSTKDKVDEKPQQKTTEDALKAQVYIHFLAASSREIQENRQIVSEEERRRLNITGNSYVNTKYILDRINVVLRQEKMFRESLVERFVMQKQDKLLSNRESIEHKLMVLSGRRAPQRQEAEYDYSQTRARAFDLNKYLELKKQLESMSR